MSLLKSTLGLALLLSFAGISHAQDDVETIEAVEKVPSKKLQERGERIRGPITSLRMAGLMLVGFDENTDYRITRTEFDTGHQQAFKKADADNSGTLSLFELEDWRLKALGSLDARPGNLAFDKDYDQRVTREEFNDVLGHVFKVTDKDEDGIIIFSELVHVFEMPTRRLSEDGRERPNGTGQQQRNRRRGGF